MATARDVEGGPAPPTRRADFVNDTVSDVILTLDSRKRSAQEPELRGGSRIFRASVADTAVSPDGHRAKSGERLTATGQSRQSVHLDILALRFDAVGISAQGAQR